MSYLRRSLVSFVILACLTQLTFVTPALARGAKPSKQERLSRVMDPTTNVEEFRQEVFGYLTEFEDVLGVLAEVPAVRAKFDQAGLQPLAALAKAKENLGELSPEQLSLMRAAYARFPGWREAPQAIDSLIKPQLRQRVASKGPDGPDSGKVVPLVADSCADGLSAGITNTDISIAAAVLIAAEAVMEALPTDAFTIVAREIPVGLVAAAAGAVLALKTLKDIKDDCNGATFQSDIKSQVTSSTTSILNKVDAAKTTIVDKVEATKTTIVDTVEAAKNTVAAKVDANAATIMDNDNANKTSIVNNDNANKNELRDLMLRTQIEADLAQADSATPVALYLTPTAKGGYLDLVQTIVTQTLANIQAAGGDVSAAQSLLTQANTAKTAGQFKAAYALYRKAYKAASK
ncbi:MAG TPA: hypothetical protein VFF31_34505 [Blastocatellia bacterium]|nr:hypothetical protein [Blastocatellia bacterium]